jgi:ribosome maturation factor RimP
VSRDLSAALDVHEEVVPGHYRLEVSSPGLERPLVKLGDFDRFAGREVKIRTKHPIGDRKNLHGRLLGTAGGQVRLEMEGNELSISHDDIVKANLVHRF